MIELLDLTMKDIEKLADSYGLARDNLSNLVEKLNDEIINIKKSYRAEIRRLVSIAQEKRSELYAAVETNPDLFKSPKTVTFHNTKLGYQKEKDQVEWSNEEQVIKLIEKNMPDKTQILIKTTKKLLKDEVKKLKDDELKKIAVRKKTGTDQVLIKPVDSEIDKFVEALLAEADKDEKD